MLRMRRVAQLGQGRVALPADRHLRRIGLHAASLSRDRAIAAAVASDRSVVGSGRSVVVVAVGAVDVALAVAVRRMRVGLAASGSGVPCWDSFSTSVTCALSTRNLSTLSWRSEYVTLSIRPSRCHSARSLAGGDVARLRGRLDVLGRARRR